MWLNHCVEKLEMKKVFVMPRLCPKIAGTGPSPPRPWVQDKRWYQMDVLPCLCVSGLPGLLVPLVFTRLLNFNQTPEITPWSENVILPLCSSNFSNSVTWLAFLFIITKLVTSECHEFDKRSCTLGCLLKKNRFTANGAALV